MNEKLKDFIGELLLLLTNLHIRYEYDSTEGIEIHSDLTGRDLIAIANFAGERGFYVELRPRTSKSLWLSILNYEITTYPLQKLTEI